MRHTAPQQGRSAREVCDVLDVGRTHHTDAVLGDVGEHSVELDALLRASADQIVIRHPGDRQHGLTIQYARYLAEQLHLLQERRRGGSPNVTITHVFVDRLRPDEIQDVALYYGSAEPLVR